MSDLQPPPPPRPRKRRWKLYLFLLLLLAGAAGGGIWWSRRKEPAAEVFVEKLARRDLEAVVRESGKVRAKTSVLLSANTVGLVKEVLAHEGERVTAGQPLIQIDPTPFEIAISQAEVAVRQSEQRLEIARTQLERTKLKLERERELGALGAREKVDELTADFDVQKNEVEAAKLTVTSEQARLERERHELTKVRITSPIDGVILRSNVERGQTTVMGTMNAAGTELMTVADLSVLQVELEVGEAVILDVKVGQPARVEIDALPNRKLAGKVSDVGTSPITTAGGQQERGVAFRVVVTLDETVEGVRPGFSASAEIVTATRAQVLAVPIRSLVARELPAAGKTEEAGAAGNPADPAAVAIPTKKELKEGAFVVGPDGKSLFQPVKIGITGKEHFEVLEGLTEGAEVLTGPHKTLRDLKEGERIERKPEP
ncbi:MAG: efflux RND transporter periplasmic adaptor subunit [Planctomycetes bacterium]|nr:efflux RND transporter periplasmic adaptor subunit [Planctomycetota bacterium]